MKNAVPIVILFALFLAGCTSQKNTPLFVQQDVSTQPTELPEITPPHIVASSSATPKPRPTTPPVKITSTLTINQLPSEFHSDDSRDMKAVDTIIVHSLYNPKVKNGITIEDAKSVLDQSKVSSHYVIARDGKIYQLVAEEYQAWHAGDSQMPKPDGRKSVNLFSIGIELIGTETSGFTTAQIDSLTNIVADIATRLPIKHVLGHSDIAPGRKTDPWQFNWRAWQAQLTLKAGNKFTFYH